MPLIKPLIPPAVFDRAFLFITMKGYNQRLDVKTDRIKPAEFERIYLYQIRNSESIIYVGITNDIKATKSRHCYVSAIYNANMEIIGEFYDRKLAEFFEMVLIIECRRNGVKLLNKVNKFV